MPEPIPGTTPVKDQRPQPRGVLPKHAQSWLMIALAVGILAVIVFTGHSEPPVPSAVGGTAPAAPDANRLRELQERLRLLNEQAHRQTGEPPAELPVATTQTNTYAPTDALESEKKRLEYESLFARVVIPGDGRHSQSSRPTFAQHGGTGATVPSESAAGAPTLDAIVDAVVRASQRQPVAQANGAVSVSNPKTPNVDSSQPIGATAADRISPLISGPQYRLPEGTLIPTVLTNRLDGSSAAPVNCLVNAPVYAPNSQEVLIPRGARVLGRTTPVQVLGESRLAVSFHRLLMPNGTEYSLDQFLGLNQVGDAGLRDRVNQHYLSTFGAAAAVGLLTGLSQAFATSGLTRGDGDRTVVVAGSAGETTQATARVLDRFLNRPPTVTIREGHRVHVYITSGLDLPAYPSPGS